VEPLTPAEARVVGCLVEKQRTVPDTYPLTANALLAACNQSTNRDPVVDYDERTVLGAIDSLKAKGLARIVHPSAGSRSTKYRHVLDEALGLDAGEVAVVAVLLLRGAQTAAELRARTERLQVDDVDAALDALAGRELVRQLERRPGEREARWMHLLGDGTVEEAAAPAPASSPSSPGLADRVAALEAEVAELRDVVAELRTLLD
jgi:uncharacterized protein